MMLTDLAPLVVSHSITQAVNFDLMRKEALHMQLGRVSGVLGSA